MKKDLPTARIVARYDITDDLAIFTLAPLVPMTFASGQYCTVALNGIPRPYSICSAPYEQQLELFVKLVPPPVGNLTPLLWEGREGDFVTLYPKAKGVFTLDTSRPNHFMIATGTGIAPFISMVRSTPQFSGRIVVLYGVRYQDEFGYDGELAITPGILYYPAVSKPDEKRNAGWRGLGGRVTTHVEALLAELGFDQTNSTVYACGNPDMIRDVKGILLPKGYTVKEEKYWKEDKNSSS